MDAVVVSNWKKNNERHHRSAQEKKSDPLAHVASRIASLSTDVGALPLWAQTFGEIVRTNFRLPAKVMYEFVGKCPLPVNGGRNLRVEFVERHWTEKVLRELGDPKVEADRMARRFATHLQLANFLSAEAFLKARVEIEGIYSSAGAAIPQEVTDRVKNCDGWRMANGGYTTEQLVAAGFKRSLAKEGLYKDPITGTEIDISPRKSNSDRSGRRSFGSREERGRNEMLSAFDPAKRPAKKHHEIPVLTREEMEANRRAKIEGRLARRATAHKAAADRKQAQKAAKKAAGEKKGGKRGGR